MNILIPHTWLLEHLETNATPEQIQELLSLSGPSVERIYDREGESVYDIEITANRVDCMSVRGIAREAAVILTYANIPSRLKPLNSIDFNVPQTPLPLPVINDPHKLSKRISALILDNVSQSPTPDWMAKRLRQIDQNVHNAPIDITNYVTHEIGHPCHAFDYDKIMSLGGQINITQAEVGMKFTTLDGASYETQGNEVIFTNAQGEIIDLPAIKGTLNSAVDSNTKRILLWIESLPSDLIRQASMSHNIRTIAAQLNEKNVDPALALPTLHLAVNLYQQLTNSNQVSSLLDIYDQPTISKSFSLPLSRIEDYLGIQIPNETIIQILNDLECQTQLSVEQIIITPPSFRPDLTMDADAIEEIARIYGYHNIPSVLMSGLIPTQNQADVNFDLEFQIKHFLSASNWQEIYSYSLVSQSLIDQEKKYISITREPLKLANPLTEDHVFLRQSLIASLLEIYSQNKTITDLQIFEIANVYLPQDSKLPQEELHLTLLSNHPFRQIRTQIEHLLNSLFIKDITITQDKSTQGQIYATYQNQQIYLGNVYALSDNIFAFDFTFTQIIAIQASHPHLTSTNLYPPIIQDFTFEFPSQIRVGQIINDLKQIPFVSQIDYLNSYKNSYTFRIYFQDLTKNLTDSDIQPLRLKIADLISQNHHGQLK